MLELYREQVLLTPYVRKTYKDNPKMGRWITYKAVSCSYDLIKKGDLLTARIKNFLEGYMIMSAEATKNDGYQRRLILGIQSRTNHNKIINKQSLLDRVVLNSKGIYHQALDKDNLMYHINKQKVIPVIGYNILNGTFSFKDSE